MRYLRMLSNSVIAGILASGYLTVLLLLLNPGYPLDTAALGALAVMLGVAYGANLTVVFYALIVLRQILAVEVLSPGWVSVRLLSWLFTFAAVGGAVVMWMNLRGFGPVLDVDTARRIASGAVVVSAAAAIFLAIAIAHIGRRGGRVSASILVMTAVLSVVLPVGIAADGRADERADERADGRADGRADDRADEPAASKSEDDVGAKAGAGRLVMLLLDGASLDVISPAVAEGRLPNFGRVFDGGSVLHLATLRPTQAEPVWSVVATGRPPMQNGVRSSASYRVPGVTAHLSVLPDYCFAQALVRFGFLSREPHTADDLTARPLWSILSAQGLPVGVIGWPLTHPAPRVRGTLVSDRFHRMNDTELALDGPSAVWPPALLEAARAGLSGDLDPDPVSLVAVAGSTPAGDSDVPSDPAPVIADRVHARLLATLDTASLRFVAARLPGVDAVGHYFLRYAVPFAFGDVSEDERVRLGARFSNATTALSTPSWVV